MTSNARLESRDPRLAHIEFDELFGPDVCRPGEQIVVDIAVI
jgi:hypothetical protein